MEKTTRRKKIGLFLKTKLNITQVPANAVLCVTQDFASLVRAFASLVRALVT